MADLSDFMDFMEDDDNDGGFLSPPIPSAKYPKESGGHQYRVPSPDALTGLRLTALADISIKAAKNPGELGEKDAKRLRLDDQEERDFIQQVLTPELVEEMVADGVKWTHVKRLASYAFTYFAIGADAAEQAAKSGVFSGKAQTAPPQNRQARRQQPKTGGTRPTRSGSAASRKQTTASS